MLACVGLTVAFFALCLWRLWLPSAPFFDEIHYLPAARNLLAGGDYINAEHPPLGKQILALGMSMLGTIHGAGGCCPRLPGRWRCSPGCARCGW